MKSITLPLWTAVLLLLVLSSCRASDEYLTPSSVYEQNQIGTTAFDTEPDPPKDVPKDYDDWKIKLKN